MGAEGIDVGPVWGTVRMKFGAAADRLIATGRNLTVGEEFQKTARDPGLANVGIGAGDKERPHVHRNQMVRQGAVSGC